MVSRWKKTAGLVLAAGLLGGWAMAAEPDAVVPLWPGNGVPPGVQVQEPKNENPGDDGLIRRVDKPELRAFLPPADRATGTAVIICPGGGNNLLDWKAHVADFIADYRQQGIAVIALLYKVPTTSELALQDGKRAVRLVRSHAKQWKLDPHKIGMQGYSSGSHLIVNLISHADDGNPKAKDSVDRLSCRPDFAVLMCPWNIWKVDKYPLHAPLPPVFLASADDDKLSFNFAVPLAARLKELKVPVLFWKVHGGGHSAFHKHSPWDKWMEQLVPWLKQQGFLPRGEGG
jgi:acetyl esterase/lipase